MDIPAQNSGLLSTLRRDSRFFLPALSGILLGLLFYFTAWWPLVFVSLVPLIFFLERYAKTKKEIFIGIGLALIVMSAIILAAFHPSSLFISYLRNTILGHAAPWMRAPLTLKLGIYIAWLVFSLWFAIPFLIIFAWGYWLWCKHSLSEKYRQHLGLLIIPFLWVLAEFGRALFSSGFTFGHLGYRIIDFLPLAITSRVWGIYGIGFIILLVNQAATQVILRQKLKPAIFILGTAVLILGAGFLMVEKERTNGWDGPALKIAVIQGGARHDDFFDQIPTPLLPPYGTLLYQVPEGEDLVLFPEGVTEKPINPRTTGLFSENQQFFSSVAKEKDYKVLLVGHDIVDPDSLRLANSMIAWGKEGFEGIYRKRVLFPIGENFSILTKFFPQIFLPSMNYIPGDTERGTISTSIGRLGTVICQEINLPGLFRSDIKVGAELLVSGGSEWQFSGKVQEEELRIARMRALESRRYFARAMKEGTSAIIDPLGRVLSRPAPGQEIAILEGKVKLLKSTTPYIRYGSQARIIFWAGTTLAIFLYFIRKKFDIG